MNLPQENSYEIVPERLTFAIVLRQPQNTANTYCYTIENKEKFYYQPFFSDFGPLSILQIHRFVKLTARKLELHKGRVIFYSSKSPQNIANSVLLAGAFRVIYLHMEPEEAFRPFVSIASSLKPYRDASSFPSTYDLTVMSCLKGLYHGMRLGWYDPATFDEVSWEHNEIVMNGDMNWLIPNKLLAFASPYDKNELMEGWYVSTPTDLVPKFQKMGIEHVVRLCKNFYNEKVFQRAGIKHTELYFDDGTCPPSSVLRSWLKLIEGPECIALHCKAGLGRTGTLAGCYMIKNYGFTADEAIGWIRICRPGSIIGPQQEYLQKYYHSFRQSTVMMSPTSVKQTHSPNKVLRKMHEPPPPQHNQKTPRRSLQSSASITQTPPRSRTKKDPMTPQITRTVKSTKEFEEDDNTTVKMKTVPKTPKPPQPRKMKRDFLSSHVPK